MPLAGNSLKILEKLKKNKYKDYFNLSQNFALHFEY